MSPPISADPSRRELENAENLPLGGYRGHSGPRLLRPIRTLISLVFLGLTVWCAFTVPLGTRTFAEHMDRIGQTPEARELLDSTRSTVNPVLEEATERMLGEYIEAPTQASTPASSSAPIPTRTAPPRASGEGRSLDLE